MKMPPPPPSAAAVPRLRSWLSLLLLVSYGLRVGLSALGGQGFWPDEVRYSDARYAAADLVHGQWGQAARQLLHADHTLFRWFALPAALFETLAGPHPAIVASYFSLYSVLPILLVWAIARRGGAGEEEALWAAFLTACANCLFFYSRHFFPYDISLGANLAALWLGMGRWSWRNSLLTGVLAGVGFLTYNGYWLLGGIILVLHSLLGEGGGRKLLPRAFWSGAGLLLPIVPVVGLARVFGSNMVSEEAQWGALARGDFPFAHRVIPEYLWYAEGWLLPLWLAAFLYAVVGATLDRRWGRLGWYASGLFLVGGGLWGMSDLVPVFAVQGRKVRCLVPFLCLGAALGLWRFLAARTQTRRAWTFLIAAVVLCCTVRNFAGPFRQYFPDAFQRRSAELIAESPAAAYRLAFAESLWGLPLDPALPASRPLLRAEHPLQFLPYQYEGYDTAQRAEINRHDVSMRLFRIPAELTDGGGRWAGYPGPLRWSVIFPTDRESLAEPLVTSGQPGRGDFLFVRYLDRRHVAFGLDHWGSGAAISVPVEIDYARAHEIVVSLGSLLAPAAAGLDGKFPELAGWRDQVLVLFDGRPVFHWPQAPWPSARREVMLGVNLIGGTAVQLNFSGQVLKLDSAPLATVGPALRGPVLGALAENSWIRDWRPGAPLEVSRAEDAGLVRRDLAGRGESLAAVSFRLPAPQERRAQPILAFIRTDGAVGLLAMRRSPAGPEIGWRDGEGWRWSGPVAPPTAEPHTVEMQWNRPGAGPADERLRRLAAMLRVDGGLFPHPHPQFFDVPVTKVLSWKDPAPAEASLAPFFTGEVETAPARPDLPLVRDGAPATRRFRLAVRFPSGRTGRNEPLVIAGAAGAADGLYVHYERPGWIRVGFDHWGVGGSLSEPVAVAEDRYQILEVTLGSGSWAEPRGREVRASLGGRPVLQAAADVYPAPPPEVRIGRNRINLSTSDPDFSGEIFPLEDEGSQP